ncbi:Fasciclin-1, partial [Stegodyphus mimosarum]
MELVNFAPGFKELLNSSHEKSLFAPTNEAIRQLPPEAIGTIKTNITAITNLLKLHLVMKSISMDDVLYGRYREYVSADNRNSLYFRILGDEKNKTLTVDGVGVKAAAVQADIGAIDGMVHIIDRLLGMPYQTVFLKLQSDPDLRITYELSEQDGWGQILSGNDKRFTFFAPSDDAWMQLKRNMPTVYKQLTMKAFPYHTKKILDRHLVVNRELRSSDLERINEIQMVHGRFKVIHLEHPGGELLLEWEGRQARIVRPDVQTVNGVIHVIDRVMMMRRDLTKSGAPIGALSNGFLSIIPAFFSVAIFF